MKKLFTALAASLAIAAAPAMAKKPNMDSIYDTAVMDGRFTILVDLLDAVGLDGVLQDEGQFTVFAPTDEAFEETFGDGVTADAIVGVLVAECGLSLVASSATNILLHHVTDGRRWSNSVVGKNTKNIEMLNAEYIWVRNDGSIRDASGADEADIAIPDINAKNGIVHAIDYVLMPSELCVD
jgi:uncharacterized surface protein with fasciclin (FAS1) repeats